MRSATRDSWVVTAGSVLIAVLVIVFWEILSKNLFVIPAPGATFHAFVKLYGSGDLTAALAATFRNVAVAFILSVIVGAILGVLIGRSQYWYEVLNPMIVAGNGIPKIILYPLILLIFGLNPRAMVAMGFIHGVFPVLINVMAAVHDLKPIYVKVGRSLKAGTWHMLTKVYMPAISLPLVVSVRLSFDLAVVGVILAELFASKVGMGLLIRHDYNLGMYTEMMSVIMVLFIIALVGSLILWGVERRMRRFVA